MNHAGTVHINGRNYTIATNDEPTAESSLSKYGEVVLTGTRGATYWSERWHGTHTLRFYTTPTKGLPKPALEGETFVIEEASEGNEITLRQATHDEAFAAWDKFRNDHKGA